MRKIAITGHGVICPGSSDSKAFWEQIRAGQARSSTPTAMPDSKLNVAEITDNSFVDALPVKAAALDRSAQFAVHAAGEALDMAGINAETADLSRVAVIIGNGGAGLTSMDEQFERLYRQNQTRSHPLAVAKSMSSSSASWVSMAFGLRGPTFVIASACASGTHAIGIASELIKSGLADIAIAGGTEAPMGEGTLRAWDSMRILSPDYCRPFSNGRLGLVLSEGAGMLVLEAEDHAKARGAQIKSYLSGFSCSADAGDIFNPMVEGMSNVMADAVAKAGLTPGDVDYINAHGTGTRTNDLVETQAIKAVFGADTAPPVSSIKSTTGHGLGASGGIEAVGTILAMQNSMLPPTANYLEQDPECDLDYVPNQARAASVRTAISNSFAFGGLNASLVFTA